MQSRVASAAAGDPYSMQPAEYLIQRFRASGSPHAFASPSTTPPKVALADDDDGGGGGSTHASPRSGGSVDCLSDTASQSSADGYINDCIRATETIYLARAELPEGSRLWHAVMAELSPRHSLENLSSSSAAAASGASQRLGSDKSGLIGAASDGGHQLHQRARANTMPSSVDATQATNKARPRTQQRVRFA